MTIGNRIRALRQEKGYTQEYIAEQLGVSRQAVSKWEQDQSSPDTNNLIALSALLDASIEYIATGNSAKEQRIDINTLRQIAMEQIKEEHLKNRYDAIARWSFILFFCWFGIWAFGLLTGIFDEFHTIGSMGMGYWFRPYGDSGIAQILEFLYVACYWAHLILFIIFLFSDNKKKK